MKFINFLKNFYLNNKSANKILWLYSISGILMMFCLLAVFNFFQNDSQHYTFLAKAFLGGRLFFDGSEPFFGGFTDLSFWNGKAYWPLGPFPAVIMMPFVAIFGTQMLQGYLSIILVAISFFILWKIAKRFNFNSGNALWLAVFFIFGSAYLGVAINPSSWFFAHLTGVLLLLLALIFFMSKRNLWLVGIFLGFSAATRFNYSMAPAFFILMILMEPGVFKLKLVKISKIVIPIFFIVSLLFLYNWARFGNPLESGYGIQDFHPQQMAARDAGLFSVKHIPANLFYFLFNGPKGVFANDNPLLLQFPFIKADYCGLSILFTSPLFLYIFSASLKKKIVRAAAIASFLMLAFVFLFFGIGAVQYGYRFAIDAYPFLYVLLCNSSLVLNFSFKAKALILISVFLNWYMILTFYL